MFHFHFEFLPLLVRFPACHMPFLTPLTKPRGMEESARDQETPGKEKSYRAMFENRVLLDKFFPLALFLVRSKRVGPFGLVVKYRPL